MRLTIIVFLLLSISSYSQHPYYYTLNTDNQLPANEVYYIFQDNQSYIWLGTSAGLYRYDGKNYKTYSNLLQNSRAVSNIQQSSDGKLWCQNFTGQIFYVMNDSLHLAQAQNVTQSNNPVFVTAKNDAFYLSTDSGIIVFQKSVKQFLTLPKVKHHKSQPCFVTDLLFTQQKLFVAERDAVGYFKGKTFHVITKASSSAKLPDVYRHSYLYEVTGKILLLAHGEKQNSIWQIRNDSLIWLRDLPASLQRVFALHPDGKGHIWVGSSNGVLCLDENLNELYNGKIFFSGKSISDVLADEEGNYWFSTLSDGIFIVPSLDVWVMTEANSELPDQRVKQLEKDNKGNLFVGMQNGMLSKWNIDNNKLHTISFPFSPYEIQALYYDSVKNTLLVGQNNFWSVDAGSLRSTKISVIENVKVISTTAKPQELLIGTVNYGATAFGGSVLPQLQHTLRAKRVRCAAYLPSTKKLFVGYADGVYVYDELGEREVKCNGEPIYANDLASFENGELFIATKSGIFSINNSAIQKVNVLPNEFISKLCANKTVLWCSAQNRLLKYDLTTETIQEFNRLDGLPTTETYDMELHAGKLYLATPKGLVFFPTHLNGQNLTSPQIFITRFAIHEVDTVLSNSYVLPFSKNNITVHFDAVAFRAQGSFTFKYRLLGLDTAWVSEGSNSNFARYPSLPAGEFVFEVKAVNEDGTESIQPASVRIHILKPYWQTWWFFVLCGLVLVVVVSGLFVLRIRSIKQKNTLEQRYANSKLSALKSQMNPHFMFNALSSIQDLVLQQKSELAQIYLGKFSNLTRKVLDASSVEFIPLQNEIDMLTLYLELEALRFEGELEYNIILPNDEEALEQQIPSMIVQPFVENALKHGLLHHSGKKKLCLTFEVKNNLIKIVIDDNGVGRAASAAIKKRNHQSFATSATEERLNLLRDYFHLRIELKITDKFEAEKPIGTQVEILITPPET